MTGHTALFRLAALAGVLLATAVTGCTDGKARADYERQLQICSAGERQGVLDTAADACGAALNIARDRGYPSAGISDLSFRLGRIERKRGRFDDAEPLVRASLEFETGAGDSVVVATRLIELSFILAGQDRWDEGVTLLEGAEPWVQDLEDHERKNAANAFRGYSAQLRKTGDATIASRFEALASKLGEP